MACTRSKCRQSRLRRQRSLAQALGSGQAETQDRTRQIGTGCPRPPGASAVRRGGAQGCRPGGLSRRLGTRPSLRRRSVGASALSFASHSIWVAGIGARAVPPAGPPGPARGATGTRAPSGRPGGRLSSGPSRPGRACSRAPCESPLGPWGVPWVALRHPRYGDFCPGTLFGLPLHAMADARAVAMQPLGGRRFPAIAGASSSAGFPGLPELGPPTRGPTFQAPIAATLGAGSERPVASSDVPLCAQLRAPGISSPTRRLGQAKRRPNTALVQTLCWVIAIARPNLRAGVWSLAGARPNGRRLARRGVP